MHAFIHVNEPLQHEIVQAFNEAHPDVRVTIEPTEWNTAAEKLAIRTAAGAPPDLISISPWDFMQLIASGDNLLMDITRLVEQDLAEREDIPEPVWETVRHRGAIYAIPQRISTYVTLYNTEMFDQAGLPRLPYDWHDASWNWERLQESVRRLTLDTNGDGVYDRFGLQNSFPTEFAPVLFQAGGNYFDEAYERFILPEPEGMSAVNLILEMHKNGHIGGSFLSGTAAIDLGGIPWETESAQQAGLSWDVAAHPQGPGGPATSIGPIPVAISAHTRHPEEAWTFLKYYMSPEISARHNQGGVLIQPRRSITGDPRYYPPYINHDHARVFMQTLEVGQPLRHRHKNAAAMLQLIDDTLRSIWRLEKAPEVALSEITPTIQALLADR